MRKVDLTMEEITKYSVIKKLVETDGSKQRAATTLNCTVRHVNRMINGYKEFGKEFFVHGNKGRQWIVNTFYNNIYSDKLDLY
ncbi:MAG: transposase, partial [Clostridium sp.]